MTVQPPPPCLLAAEVRPWIASTIATLTATAAAAPTPELKSSAQPAGPHDYRHLLQATPAGWPTRLHWCVWIEPAAEQGPASMWEKRWWQAVHAATGSWGRQVSITLVNHPEQAQILLWRRRPPIQNQRASHGRALLQILDVRRGDRWEREPRVDVLISPGQAQPAMQATALHELGHAFGLWGHSDHPADAMAAKPGATPVLELSDRDRATLQWLQAQPGLRQDQLPGR